MTAREDSLGSLLADISACRICRDCPDGGPERALPHEPRPVCFASTRAPILIAGQAPGMRVHLSGRPFTDPSGDRLRDWLGVGDAQFYDPDNFAIVPMGFCFPGNDARGGDLPPRRECAPAWRGPVMELMPQVRLVLAIGQYAQAWHLGPLRRKSLTDTVRNWRSILDASGPERPVLPLPHPSWRNSGWIRKNPWFETELLPELRKRVSMLISPRDGMSSSR
ncbi:MAG: uracil-DNA glycosylase family protein [Hoeflea sp.]|uniref:uracil-DNA glycosylase family protein n=1 Tax=Hoeflea sp. TaxID=1940281 RepID=UPI001D9E7457|nr:uracil-DNA glycosylase family protein [Hoeflea sp.]MBU4530559.1 uracil-DNA glycosylase family protein [Alphaproteobacteria bacterium]MBU4545346.1 uracil-DNA glycosylase family protein [Alphaproteobacteria bacterium]MBU4548995.1 uracil-DNA glycosylase family protein [Alphaproteobacteria bacterium]MBV1722150.1 uracil-DNA glycosylase family protein [Hoeflea sp.]MBV1761500.1 uracil-DNA glycosylase family protein [Hoeflea sp.]